jgi:hypothetical protein
MSPPVTADRATTPLVVEKRRIEPTNSDGADRTSSELSEHRDRRTAEKVP